MTRELNCDQVCWMLDAIGRYIKKDPTLPRVSREHELKKYALLYELMEAANLGFQDELAQRNATPNEVFDFDVRKDTSTRQRNSLDQHIKREWAKNQEATPGTVIGSGWTHYTTTPEVPL